MGTAPACSIMPSTTRTEDSLATADGVTAQAAPWNRSMLAAEGPLRSEPAIGWVPITLTLLPYTSCAFVMKDAFVLHVSVMIVPSET